MYLVFKEDLISFIRIISTFVNIYDIYDVSSIVYDKLILEIFAGVLTY